MHKHLSAVTWRFVFEIICNFLSFLHYNCIILAYLLIYGNSIKAFWSLYPFTCSLDFFPPHQLSWFSFFALSFHVAPRSSVSLNFQGPSYPSVWAVSNFLWLISGSKSCLIASNSVLTLVKIFLNVTLIQLAATHGQGMFHLLFIVLLCAAYFFHLSAVIFSLCFRQPLFLLRTHCSCRWL